MRVATNTEADEDNYFDFSNKLSPSCKEEMGQLGSYRVEQIKHTEFTTQPNTKTSQRFTEHAEKHLEFETENEEINYLRRHVEELNEDHAEQLRVLNKKFEEVKKINLEERQNSKFNEEELLMKSNEQQLENKKLISRNKILDNRLYKSSLIRRGVYC